MVLLHADAVAQDGAARVRTTGIHGDHRDRLPFLADQTCELIAQRTLAGARRTGDANDKSSPGMRK